MAGDEPSRASSSCATRRTGTSGSASAHSCRNPSYAARLAATSPAIANLDDDALTLEVVIGADDGAVHVLASDGTELAGWPALVGDFAEPHLYDVAVAEDGAITLVGELEMVMRSPVGGATWARVH